MLHYKFKPHHIAYLANGVYAAQKRPVAGEPMLDYWKIEAGLGVHQVTAFVSYETLAGNGQYAFITPLATLHEHQGWADMLLTTPANCVEDLTVRAVLRFSPGKLDVRVHQFYFADTPAGTKTDTLGHELDWDLSVEPSKSFSAALRFARFWPNSNNSAFYSAKRTVMLTLVQKFN